MYVSEYYSRHDDTTTMLCSDEVEPLSASRGGVPGFLWGRVGGLGHVVGPVAAVGVLPDELDGDGALDVIGHVEQLATHDPDIVLLETGLGLGGGGCRSPLDGDWLLLLGRWRRLLSVALSSRTITLSLDSCHWILEPNNNSPIQYLQLGHLGQ